MEYDEGREESGGSHQVNVHELQTRNLAQGSPPKSVVCSEPRQSSGVWRWAPGSPPGDLALEKVYFPQDPHLKMLMDFYCPGDRTVSAYVLVIENILRCRDLKCPSRI